MGSPAKKQDDDVSIALDISTDREERLSKNFDDPVLEDMIPGMVDSPAPLTVVEAAEAVQELVLEASGEGSGEPDSAVDLSFDFSSDNLPMPGAAEAAVSIPPAPALESTHEPTSMVFLDSPGPVSGHDAARWEMAEKLFELVVSEHSFDQLMDAILAAVVSAVQAQAGSVLKLDHDAGDFFFRCSLGGANPVEKLKAFRIPSGKGIVGHVAETREVLLLRDLKEDQMQMRAISAGVGFDAVTCMAAPILVGNQLYGVIELFNKKDGSHFDEKDLAVFGQGVRMMAKVLEVRFLMAELIRGRS